MTTPLQELLSQRIREHGPMPFAAYMQLALYHPVHGYYASGATRTGWRGDFVTSPELDPAFGTLWTRAFEMMWRDAGEPDAFEVVELGGGEAGFAAGVLDAASGPFAEALSYRLVERTPAAEQRQRERLGDVTRVTWSASITEVPPVPAGCFFANEVLDNLPVHLVQQWDGELREVCVELGSRGELQRTLRPASSPELGRFLSRCGVDLPEGHSYEVQLAAESLATRCASLLGAGAVVFVDYGEDAGSLARRPHGSLLCYSSAGPDERPLERPGEKDITVHANWTAVADALRRAGATVALPVRQRQVLKQLGIDRLHDELRGDFARSSAAGDGPAALRALSRRQALGALSDEGGLGALQVLVAAIGAALPGFASR